MRQKYYLVILFCFTMFAGKAQIGGEYTYQFLELTNSARIAAMGGNQIAILDSTDLNLPYHNPASLHKAMGKQSIGKLCELYDRHQLWVCSYAKSFDSIGNFAIGIHYINYGKFQEATEFGELTGRNFKAAEYAFHLIYSNNYKRLKLRGGNQTYSVGVRKLPVIWNSCRFWSKYCQ